MDKSPGMGRIALIESGEDTPRMLRALREVAHVGRPGVSILLHRPGDRRARLAREADETYALEGSIEEGLRAVRADAAWVGPVPIARRAENEYVGAPTGIMDQSAALLSQAGHALLLDCRSGIGTAVPLDPGAAGLALLVIDTRVRHDLTDGGSLARLLYELRPDEVYNLGAQSHVKVSFEIPEYTADVVGTGALRALDAVRHYAKTSGKRPRYYQAGSSEMFGAACDCMKS